MRRIALFLIALLAIGTASAQEYNLTTGQPIRVRLVSTIDTDQIQTIPSAIVDANVTDKDGNVIISRGTNVELSVDMRSPRGLGRGGYIKVECLSTTAVDGQKIFLMGGLQSSGKDREELAIGLGVGAGIVAFPFGLFCLCIKGEEAYVAGTTVITNVVVDDNYTIKH